MVASLIARVITARHIHVRPGLGATTSRLALQRASNAALPRISRSPSFQRWLANWEGRNQRGILNIGFARVLHFGPVILQVCGQVRFVCGRIGIGIDVFFSAPPPAEQPASCDEKRSQAPDRQHYRRPDIRCHCATRHLGNPLGPASAGLFWGRLCSKVEAPRARSVHMASPTPHKICQSSASLKAQSGRYDPEHHTGPRSWARRAAEMASKHATARDCIHDCGGNCASL
jgi:hypothetical protein